ncbi:FAD-dependent oxidoreductase [Sporanaerobium hydrogeniformans]|uniref:FAD-dependent oxidoreductase n=1 Tax=Sporanaerobium hydrogeniformans TaxID=3072179 RepID=A0AC61DB84_9FIRM|nr:FAD-binding oxidoreductase [Sporanaerobium hydrogeniformans]PHV70486.1 FAD-dependent oxidoreductase [Sporanaerobium hydrogeniformans]
MGLHYVQGQALFTHTHPIPRQYPYLTENLETDIIIIGGGVTGSILGYYFSKANIPAILIEKHRIGHGSTSITTSLLQYELDSNARELEKYMPLEKTLHAYHLGLKALSEIDAFIKEKGNTCHFEWKDTLLYTAKQTEVCEMEEEYTIRKKGGLEVDFLTTTNNPFSFDLKGGVYAHKGGAQLDPFLYTHHLLKVSCEQGLKVYENTQVRELHYLPDGVEVITSYGYTLKGKKVILATGYDTDSFTTRNLGVKTVTYNIATQPVSSFEGWHNKVLIRDNNDPYHYFRTTSDHRLLAGGEDIPFHTGIFDEKTAHEKYTILLAQLKTMFPHIPHIELDYAYCGAFASTPDNLGFIGEDPKHKSLWYCLGYGANGILFAILGGMMLSKLYQGEVSKDLELFKVNRFDG